MDAPAAATVEAQLSTVATAEAWAREKGTEFGTNLLAAIAIVIIGRAIAKLLVGALRRFIGRSGAEETLGKFLGNLLYGLLMVFVSLAALEKMGINTTGIAAILAAAGLAVGLALQGSLGNFAAGVMILLHRHFRSGQRIEAAGQNGVVEDLQIFATILRADDGVKVVIPNSSVTGGVIKVHDRAK